MIYFLSSIRSCFSLILTCQKGAFYDSIALFLRIFSSDFSLCIFLFVYIPGLFPPKHKKGNAHGTVHFYCNGHSVFFLSHSSTSAVITKSWFSNAIFYIALLLFGMLYCFIIQAKTVEKLFVFFVVMSYGFFVTSTVTFLHRTFRFPSDHFMYPPLALILTLIINLLLAKPFLMLMERIRTMINADLESRIWKILCSLPALFI